MTAPQTPADSPTPSTGKRSPAVVIAIVIVIVLALAGGAFVVYKLTSSKDEATPAIKTAKEVVAAIKAGDDAQLRSLSTGQGTTQLLTLKPSDAGGVTITAASCQRFDASTPTRVCTASRPGGQLNLRLIFTGGAWKVDLANIGPAGLPPTSSTTTTT